MQNCAFLLASSEPERDELHPAAARLAALQVGGGDGLTRFAQFETVITELLLLIAHTDSVLAKVSDTAALIRRCKFVCVGVPGTTGMSALTDTTGPAESLVACSEVRNVSAPL